MKPLTHLTNGHRLGKYELVEKIGQGGMAEVWLGRCCVVSGSVKTCAIKVMLPHIADDPRYRQMFSTETRLCMQLTNANIVQVFDAGQHDAALYLAMEWVDGTDLATLLGMTRQMGIEVPLSVVGYVVGELLHALDYAHRLTSGGAPLGIIHRDISPQNVMISASGEVKLADFGVARLLPDESSHEYAKGKLRYMAREQLVGRPQPASDLFGVGAILHELLSDEKFRNRRSEQGLYAEILGESLPVLERVGLPPELERLRCALLQPEATHRLQTAEEALLVLDRWTGYRNAKTGLRRLYEELFGAGAPRSGLASSIVSIAPRRHTDVLWDIVDPEASTHTHRRVETPRSSVVATDPEARPAPPPEPTRPWSRPPDTPHRAGSHGASGRWGGLVFMVVLAAITILLGLAFGRGPMPQAAASEPVLKRSGFPADRSCPQPTTR
jgi:serine/threonine protein kinase